MAPGRVDTEPSSEELLSRPRVAEARPEPGRTPLERLARGARLLAIAAAAGALAAGAVAALRPARYRAVARVLVVEPRLGSGPTVDFNLTPVRSYAALLTSPSLLAACGSEGLAGRLRVRLPENTRVLELSLSDASAARAAEVVNCAVSRAIDENRRVNAELAGRSGATVEESLQRSRTEIAALEAELAKTRQGTRLELEKQELRSALESAALSAEEERASRVRLAEAAARRRSFAETAARRPERRRFGSYLGSDAGARAAAPGTETSSPIVREEADPTRDLAERGAAEAAADEAAARSAVEASARDRARTEARAAALEAGIAREEGALSSVTRRLDAASAARVDLEKRRASAPLEAAAKAFELVALSPAVPPASPDRIPVPLAAAAGAVSALLVGALVVLSRPD